jgi:diguanylate cyclase (GGDEF)-like protein
MNKTPSFKRDRPTIGVLTGWTTLEGTLPDQYFTSVLQGMQSAAARRGCDLFLSWGIRPMINSNRIYPAWPEASPDSDFVPVGPWNTDGLIVFTPLESDKGSLYLQKLIADGHPVLFISTGEQGPQVAVDNRMGIRQAMAHLVEHGHHRIAFLAGIPADKGDSAARLNAYHEAVAEFHLDTDPQLVETGWHNHDEGYKALQRLLKSGVKFTAVMASNDNSAIGAMLAIKEAGLRIPEDIAIIGFDDQPIAVTQVPPLSSIRVPLRLVGEQALVTMLDHLTRQVPLDSVDVPTRLVQRQSCGCTPQQASAAIEGASPEQSVALKGASAEEQQEQIVNEMLSMLPAELRFPGEGEIRRICTTLTGAFHQSLADMTPAYFQTVLMDWISEWERVDGDLKPWQEMISVLRREMILLPLKWDDRSTRELAEDLLHLARAAIGESAQRQDHRHQYQQAMKALALNSLTAQLSAALSERQMIEILDHHLEETGIRHAKVLIFEAGPDDPVAWSVALNVSGEPASWRFPSRQFPPAELYAPDQRLDIILVPLVFQNEALGYAAFDATNDLRSCVVIAMQLAATTKVSRLHAQVVELSLTDALTGLHNRRYLDLFLTNEIARGHRSAHELSVIMLDIDHFKEYNDRFGHPAGDLALRQVADCLANGRRTTDVVTRIGGEEFAIILPETDGDGALKCAEKMRAAVEAISDLQHPITISLGVTVFNGDIYKPEALLQQADEALYEAKKAGRNRICIYQKK